MDAFSEILTGVKLNGALFFNAEFSAPWGFAAPASQRLATTLDLGAPHVVIYHLVTEGRAIACLAGGELISLEPGDVVVFPHGDPHLITSGADSADPQQTSAILQKVKTRDLSALRAGGGGTTTRFVCGFMSCDPHVSRPILDGLPRIFKVNVRADLSGRWLEGSIMHLVEEAGSGRVGGEAMLPKLCEHFTRYLSEPPMTYLTRWRLQLGSRYLTRTARGVADIAAGVGYASEAAFNRAFKREFKVPPAQYRREQRTSANELAKPSAS